MEPHFSAQLTLLGMACDVVGGIYLAYDLLGGEKGPLNTFFRLVNYSLLAVLIFCISLGPKFALPAGIGIGCAFGLHLENASRSNKDSFLFLLKLGLIRALGIGTGVWVNGFPKMAWLMAVIVIVMSLVLPRMGISPALVYQSEKKPQLKKQQLLIACVLGGVAMITAFIGAAFTGQSMVFQFAIRMGLTFACTTLIVTTLSPIIEWYADNLPPKTFGFIGAILFVVGFSIQALPSVAVMYDITKA
ncbi:MAG: hypothetical protein SFY67_01135 [Candidatus Melainabacteria bacterium]|nr:hypothetical protein [Candidatus Melainabacteria bacterium]